MGMQRLGACGVWAVGVVAWVSGCADTEPVMVEQPPVVVAEQLMVAERYDEAEAAIAAAMKETSPDGSALFLRGQSRQRRGQLETALADYTAAVHSGYVTPELLRLRGDIYRQMKLYDIALLDYEAALQIDPTHVETMGKVAAASVEAGRWVRALDAARQTIRLEATNIGAYRTLAAAQLIAAMPDYAEAIAALERARQLDPNNLQIAAELANVHCRAAQRFERRGELARAESAWQEAQTIDAVATARFREEAIAQASPGAAHETARPAEAAAAEAHYQTARRHLAEGESLAAIGALTDAIAVQPKMAIYYYDRGRAFLDEGSLESAVADLTAAIRLDPNKVESHAERGRAHGLMGNWSNAVFDLTHAIRLAPDLAEAYFNRGVAYFHQGRHALAVADYAQAARLSSALAESARLGMAAAHRQWAVHELHEGKWSTSVEHFDRALSLDPTLDEVTASQRAEALRGRALAAAGRGALADAVADLGEAIRLQPSDKAYRQSLGEVQLKQGAYTAAVTSLREAIRLDPHSASHLRTMLADAYRGEGDVLRAAGQHSEALSRYHLAVELSPLNGHNLLARGHTQHELSNWQAARDDYRLALRRAPELEPDVLPYLQAAERRLAPSQLTRR
jgi:tetratricopeptide (TPR) repeat protein